MRCRVFFGVAKAIRELSVRGGEIKKGTHTHRFALSSLPLIFHLFRAMPFIVDMRSLSSCSFSYIYSIHGRELKSFVPLNSRSWVARFTLFCAKPRSWIAHFTLLCAKPWSWIAHFTLLCAKPRSCVGCRNCFLLNHGRELVTADSFR